MQYKYRKKKKDQRKEWVEAGKWDVEKKSGVMKIEHYSKTCWSREEEARYLQLQMHKLRAFKNTSVFQKHGKIHFESWPNTPVSHGVVWISYSRLLYLKLNVLSCLGCFWRHLCSEMDKVESRCSCSAPFPDFGLWLALQAWMWRWSYESFLRWNDMIG